MRLFVFILFLFCVSCTNEYVVTNVTVTDFIHCKYEFTSIYDSLFIKIKVDSCGKYEIEDTIKNLELQ